MENLLKTLKVTFVTDLKELDRIVTKSPVGLDVETTTLSMSYGELVSFQLYDSDLHEAFVVPIKYEGEADLGFGLEQKTVEVKRETKGRITKAQKEAGVQKLFYEQTQVVGLNDEGMVYVRELLQRLNFVTHNAPFDGSWILYYFGVSPRIVSDSMILARMLQMPVNALKPLSKMLFPHFEGLVAFEEVTDDSAKDKIFPLPKISDADYILYAGRDAFLTHAARGKLNEALARNPDAEALKKCYSLELNLLPDLFGMTAEGLRVDPQLLVKAEEELIPIRDAAIGKFHQLAGRECSPTSPKDVAKLLYEDHKLPTGQVKTAKGGLSTSAEAIQHLEGVPLVAALQEARSYSSLVNSFKKIHSEVDVRGYVHPFYKPVGSDATSRIYTSGPSTNSWSDYVRAAVLPEEGYKFMYMDWKAAEPYIMAYMSKCRKILDWYNAGMDIHTEIGKIFTGGEVTPETRPRSKIMNLAVSYGSEGGAIVRQTHCTDDEAKLMILQYFREFPEEKEWIDEQQKEAVRTGRTITILGRPRNLNSLRTENPYLYKAAMRQVVNTCIQSSCAEIWKLYRIRSRKAFDEKGMKIKTGVFDSFLTRIPLEMDEEEAKQIAERFNDFSDLFPDFRLRSSFGFGMSWAEAKSKA